MEFAPHEQRVIQERDELKEKTEKLYAFFDTQIYKTLLVKDKELLSNQFTVMNQYLSILDERIGRFVK